MERRQWYAASTQFGTDRCRLFSGRYPCSKEAEIMKTVSVIEDTMKETRKIFERIEKSIDEIKKVYTKTKPMTMTEGAPGKAPAIQTICGRR